ncbi:MAG: hypothetical protein AB8F74_21060 [Saprospiraceae bacterium]
MRTLGLNKKSILKYLVYAVGEIALIIIGILLAVNIGDRMTNKKSNVIRCQYLEELKFTFEYDIKDVEENISGFEEWNPKLKKLLISIQNKNLTKLDSIGDKIQTATEFIFFGQRSKTKIEELKYSNINLIENRELKNRILLYQDSDVMSLRNLERRYNLVDEERRQYFSKTVLIPEFKLDKLENDKQFFSVVFQKYNQNKLMNMNYKNLLEEQYVIIKMIDAELEKVCSTN